MVDHSAHYYINRAFMRNLEAHKEAGLSELEIAKVIFAPSTIEKEEDYVPSLRAVRAMVKAEMREEDRIIAHAMRVGGYSDSAIGKRLGIAPSSVRSLLKDVKK